MSTTNAGEKTPDAPVDVSSLKSQRSVMKRNITNLKNKVEKNNANVDVTILECQLQILESYFKQICYIQTQIEKINPMDDSRSEIEELFIGAKAKLLQYIKANRRPSMGDQSLFNATTSQADQYKRLPKLKLPKFSGKYSDYSRFMHTFNSLIHEDTTLSTMDKFNYLLDCLSGPALAVVEPFQVEEANYQKAIDRLKDRFDNKALIFAEHINSIHNLPSMEQGNATSLRSLVDSVTSIKASLLSIGNTTNVMDALLIHIVHSKLDKASMIDYDEKQDFRSLPSFDECCAILNRRCQFLESRDRNKEPHTSISNKNKSKPQKISRSFVNAASLCSYCKSSDHAISRCGSFNALPVSQRFDYVKQNSLCINCLVKGHSVSKCSSQSRCRTCNGCHHTLLHRNTRDHVVKSSQEGRLSADSPSFEPSSRDVVAEPSSSRTPTCHVVRMLQQALIPTAVVLIQDECGVFQPVRALLDSGSEINFITQETAKRLKLKQIPIQREISGIADVRTNLSFEVQTKLRSRISANEWAATLLVTNRISSCHPAESVNKLTLNIPTSIQLADPWFYKPQKVDILIGTGIFFELITEGRIKLGDKEPTLINTYLGWIVGGNLTQSPPTQSVTCNVNKQVPLQNIDKMLRSFWEIEEYLVAKPKLTLEEEMCEEHYIQHTTIAEDDRIKICLPFNNLNHVLGESLLTAQRRFFALERRLQHNSILKQMYSDFMEEYAALGHMSPIENINLDEPHFFIPHQCVLRPQSTTTKIRVVFDASCKSTSKYSLNDLLMVGPTIQQDLITTLLSFRLHKFALTADICKMYRQFWVHEDDRKFQLILWRTDLHQPLKTYALNTITYGTASAPFLAIRSLFFLADKYESCFPIGAPILKTDTYVDDILTGADSFNDLLLIKTELTDLLAKAKLELAKWHSNCPDLVDKSKDEVLIQNDDRTTKALGMSWKPVDDVFCFRIEISNPESVTKRSILSITAKIFDLLGLLGPVIIRFKILIQELWIKGLDWDDPLPEALMTQWLKIFADLSNINTIEVPRFVNTFLATKCQIHGFADSSERAYGCCLYVRSWNGDGYKTTILIAKSKVAPVKRQSIPRLELCAALLLCRTWKKFKHKLENYVDKVYFWTDSKTVLLWLKTCASRLTNFVANRVAEIQQDCQDVSWRHVPTKCNPADLISRGCSAAELSSTIWFEGPSFLYLTENDWPLLKLEHDLPEEEKRKEVLKCTVIQSSSLWLTDLIERTSSYIRILHTIAYIHRVFNKIKPTKGLKITCVQPLTTSEIRDSFIFLLATIQKVEFASEFQKMQSNNLLQPSLQKLSPFMCKTKAFEKFFDLIRVGGRLSQAPIPVEAKFPILLPKTHRLTTLFVEYLHKSHLHAGPKVLIGIIRQEVWIINAREVVRKVVRKCVHCFKYQPKLMQQIMGDLPADRFRAQRPFHVCGVDFCGPFITSYRAKRRTPYKTYVALFICFASRAVHLELVSELSSDSFIACLKRFVARRGIPQRIYCDNATNFVGANNKLQSFYNQFLSSSSNTNLIECCSSIGIDFQFIPPRSPHFGGLWESAIKSAKTLLLKNAAQANLTYEELLTLIAEVEAILNSRPIVERSDNPNDGEALTASHLLIGSPLRSIPEPSLTDQNLSYLSRWQRITYLKQQFWKQWLRDYVLGLQQRSKWLTEQANVHEGQVVIVHDDNLPPQKWLLARISKTIPGPDGRVRVVELKTKNSTLRRAIQRIAPLPTES